MGVPTCAGDVSLDPFSSALWVFSPGRLAETTVVYPADVVLFEGILVFYNQDIRDMFHLRLFVDTDSDVRLSRRGNALLSPAASTCSCSLSTLRHVVKLMGFIFSSQFCEI